MTSGCFVEIFSIDSSTAWLSERALNLLSSVISLVNSWFSLIFLLAFLFTTTSVLRVFQLNLRTLASLRSLAVGTLTPTTSPSFLRTWHWSTAGPFSLMSTYPRTFSAITCHSPIVFLTLSRLWARNFLRPSGSFLWATFLPLTLLAVLLALSWLRGVTFQRALRYPTILVFPPTFFLIGTTRSFFISVKTLLVLGRSIHSAKSSSALPSSDSMSESIILEITSLDAATSDSSLMTSCSTWSN